MAATSFSLLEAQVVDGRRREPIPRGYVTVEDGRISKLGPMAEFQPPDGDHRLIEVGGGTVLPGLIDCHVHLHYGGLRSIEALTNVSVEHAMLTAVVSAGRTLDAGYTTVRDCGTVGSVASTVRDAVARGAIRGPRVVASGRILTTSAGPNRGLRVDELDRPGGFAVNADGPLDFVRAVRAQVRDGVDNVKLMASGVEIHPHIPTTQTVMSEEEMRAAVQEAHRWGKTVAVHCQSFDSAKHAVRAGVDTVEHGTRLDEEAIELFRSGRTVLVPTLCTLFSVLERGEELQLPRKQREEMVVNRAPWLESLRLAHEAGIPIAAGGDIGNRYEQGENALELHHLVAQGLTPMEAIIASTGTAADAIGVGSFTGTLEPGKLADLLVVDGDPLADIDLLGDRGRFEMIVKEGRVVGGAAGTKPEPALA